MSGCSRSGGFGAGGGGGYFNRAPISSTRWMVWCSAMGASPGFHTWLRKFPRRRSRAAVAIIDQPIAGLTVQFRHAVREHHIERLLHLHGEDAVGQAHVAARPPGRRRWHRPVLPRKLCLRDAPMLAAVAAQYRIPGCACTKPSGVRTMQASTVNLTSTSRSSFRASTCCGLAATSAGESAAVRCSETSGRRCEFTWLRPTHFSSC